MASWMVHLRIADRFLEESENIDETALCYGEYSSGQWCAK
jgi:hypothetical protein